MIDSPSPTSDRLCDRDRDVPCPCCEYNLRGLGALRCPECGVVLSDGDLRRDLERLRDEQLERAARLRWFRIVCAMLMGAAFVNATIGLRRIAVVGILLLIAAVAGVLRNWVRRLHAADPKRAHAVMNSSENPISALALLLIFPIIIAAVAALSAFV